MTAVLRYMPNFETITNYLMESICVIFRRYPILLHNKKEHVRCRLNGIQPFFGFCSKLITLDAHRNLARKMKIEMEKNG